MKYFILYLCFIFVVDTFGLYPIWAFYEKYETLPFLKDSPLQRNFWLYNIVRMINYMVIGNLFVAQIEVLNKYHLKRILQGILVLFGIYSIICFSTFGNFLYAEDISVILIGTFIVIFCLMAFFFEVLLSNRILKVNADALFYFGVAIFLWQLCIVPMKIYTSYFNPSNPDFITMYATVLRYANIFLYSMFLLGFYMDYRNRRKTVNLLSSD